MVFLNNEQIYLLTLYCGPNQLNVYCWMKLMKFQTEALVKNASKNVHLCVCVHARICVFCMDRVEKEDGGRREFSLRKVKTKERQNILLLNSTSEYSWKFRGDNLASLEKYSGLLIPIKDLSQNH